MAFSSNGKKNLDIHKRKAWHIPQRLYKINSKWFIDLNVRHKTIKLLEENKCDFGFGKEFLVMRFKAQPKTEKMDKLRFIKIINFYSIFTML